MNRMVSLKIDNVSKSFLHNNRKLDVLKDIELDIRDGEFLCVVGPSGCGKTTLLNIVAGLEDADSGRILQGASPVSAVSSERLIIFQELGLFPWLTVIENVVFGLKIRKVSSRERIAAAYRYLEMVNLTKFKDSFVHELSGGMKQRVALARALVLDPRILLMDEPFAALDAQARDKLHEELQKIWAETRKTIVFVTHNVREAVCLGDRILVFSMPPARLKASFSIALPRPREIESDGVIDNVKLIMPELRSEITKSFEKEFFHA